MPPDALALYAAVILLLPMVGFFLSSPTFLLVGLEVAVAIFATLARRWFLQRIDVELQARAAGLATAVPRLRALHVKGMLANAIQLVVVVGSVPLIVG